MPNRQEKIFIGWLDRYKGLIFKVIRTYAVEPQDREDLFQEILLQLDLDAGLGEVSADPELLKQVLLNLAQNSIQAMENGGNLTVSTSAVDTDEGGRAAVIRVADSGCGIEPADVERIFDPFFSTRRGGTGLGLSVVNQIVGKHDGVIQVESEPGLGTKMTITLPLSGEAEKP